MSTPQVRIELSENRVALVSPYNPALPAKAKLLGGRWDSAQRVWTFDPRDEARVRELARAVYGTDGSAATRTVTVRVVLDHSTPGGQAIYLFGREIANRAQRDDPVRLGAGVVVIDGRFAARGGTGRYPAVFDYEHDPVTVEIRDVPADAVTAGEGVTIVDAAADRRAALESEIVATEARLSALRAELAAL